MAARVAVVATAIAAVLYTLAGLGLTLLLAQFQAQTIDATLIDNVHLFQNRPNAVLAAAGAQSRDLNRATVIWIQFPDGTQLVTPRNAPPLPASDTGTSGPATIRVGERDYRVAGGSLGTGWVIVGAPSQALTDAIRRLVLQLVVVGIGLLAVVFLAALAIGRWSAAPIDRARRQLVDFTADASHELRTPLQVIEAEVSLSLLHERQPDSYRETIQSIGRESRRLRRMVEDLLWLARYESRPERPPAETVDLRQAARDTVERFHSLAGSRDQRLWLEPEPDQAALVQAPREWVDRLLGVLVDNACRYTPDSGSVRLAIGAEQGRVQAWVEDSGPGIRPVDRPRIFERFHRARSEGGGAGLGLAIGHAVVAGTGGRWLVGDSRLGGASIGVSWPAARPGGTPKGSVAGAGLGAPSERQPG